MVTVGFSSTPTKGRVISVVCSGIHVRYNRGQPGGASLTIGQTYRLLRKEYDTKIEKG